MTNNPSKPNQGAGAQSSLKSPPAPAQVTREKGAGTSLATAPTSPAAQDAPAKATESMRLLGAIEDNVGKLRTALGGPGTQGAGGASERPAGARSNSDRQHGQPSGN